MSVTLLCTICYVYIWTSLSEINLYYYSDDWHFVVTVMPPGGFVYGNGAVVYTRRRRIVFRVVLAGIDRTGLRKS